MLCSLPSGQSRSHSLLVWQVRIDFVRDLAVRPAELAPGNTDATCNAGVGRDRLTSFRRRLLHLLDCTEDDIPLDDGHALNLIVDDRLVRECRPRDDRGSHVRSAPELTPVCPSILGRCTS